MGEIFRQEARAQPLEFTGERWTTAAHGQIEIEHLHRYLLARDWCRGKDVLDIACGEGYGTALLAQTARRVIGIDIDIATVVHAAAQYARPNLRYIAGDARGIPLAAASVDIVVSFETLEHFSEQEAFLAEIRRIMRPDGVLVISTPDSDVYSPVGGAANTYHLRELSREEFGRLLSRQFRHVTVSAQRALVGSAIVPRDAGPGLAAAVTFERRDDRHLERSDGLPRGVYLLACASDRPITAPIGPSLYIHSHQADRAEAELDVARLQAERTDALGEIGRQAEQIVELTRARDAATAAAAAARGEVELAAQKAAGMEAEIARLRGALVQAEEDMWQRAGAAETMQAEIAALRETLRGVEQRLRQDAEEAVRIRADTADARQTVEEALRAAEDAAGKVQGLDAEIASLESALATARQVGRAALEAIAISHPISMRVETRSRSRLILRRLLGFRSHHRSDRSNPPVAVPPVALGESLPARAAR